MRWSLLILCIWSVGALSWGQMSLRWQHADGRVFRSMEVADSVTAVQTANDWVQQAQIRGFLEAGIDTFLFSSKACIALGQQGPNSRWAILHHDIPGFKPAGLGPVVNPASVVRTRLAALRFLENKGYPAAEVTMRADSLQVLPGRTLWHATLSARPGPLVTLDTVRLEGPVQLRPVVLRHMLGLAKGMPFSAKHIREAPARLNRLEFLSAQGNAKIWLSDSSALVRFPVKKRKANQFAGILGLVPVNDQTGELLLTGDVRLKLHNLLQYAEMAELNWQRLQRATQQLRVRVAWPYLLGTALGIQADLDFFRIDTAFFQLKMEAGLNYRFRGQDEVGFFLQQRLARNIRTENGLPPVFPDATTTLYGVRWLWNRLDHPVNPRRGLFFQGHMAFGEKRLTGDTLVPIDSTQRFSLEWQMRAHAQHFLPVGKRFTFLQGIQGGWTENPYLYTNDLFRIGGMQSLRGFDEASLYVSGYAYGTLEWRYLLDEFSYLNIFSDAGWIFRQTASDAFSSPVLSFGSGLSFDTPAGQFSVMYAVGSREGQGFDFQRSKLHLGYVARF